MRRHFPKLLLLIAMAAPALLFAQQHPNQERGFAADKTYHVGDVDSVNMFNGNLSVHIPLGPAFHGNGELSYQFGLSYGGNLWDQVKDNPNSNHATTYPNRRSNAGMGWIFSLGRIIPPSDPTNYTTTATVPGNNNLAPNTRWIYETPDGADHVFYGGLTAPNGSVWAYNFTRDSTYLRLHFNAALINEVEVEFPDGTVQKFQELNSGASPWTLATPGTGKFRLVQIRDRFSNALSISYTSDATHPEIWNMDDGFRQSRAYFKGVTGYYAGKTPMLDRLEIGSTFSPVMTYTLTYVDGRFDMNDDGTSHIVPLLTKVQLPGSLSYAMEMYGHPELPAYDQFTTPAVPPLHPGAFTSGHLLALRLPTLGWLEWSYTQLKLGGSSQGEIYKRQYAVAVISRSLLNESHQMSVPGFGAWTYAYKLSTDVYCPEFIETSGPRQLVSRVTTPEGVSTVNYYSAWAPGDHGLCAGETAAWTDGEYGMPFTRGVQSVVSGRPTTYLSSEVLMGAVDVTTSKDSYRVAGTPIRSHWTAYERELPETESWVSSRSMFDTNKRVTDTKTIFEDDGGRFVAQHSSSFDQYGHFRQSSSDGNFGAGDTHTSFTNYNAGSPPLDMPKWLLSTYTERCMGDDATYRGSVVASCNDLSSPAVTKTQFGSDGSLTSQRILGMGNTLRSTDLLYRFSYASNGNLLTEAFFGGDAPTVSKVSTSDPFGTDPSTPTAAYEIDHFYPSGNAPWGHSSSYAAYSFRLNDDSLDSVTGVLTASRDQTGLQTNFEYDSQLRIVWEKPQGAGGIGGLWTNYVYHDPFGTTLASIDVDQYPYNTTSGTPITHHRYFVDAFGRIVKEAIDLPGGTTSYRTTEYTASGWRTKVSELESGTPTHFTLFTNFDAFGRPGQIQAPDSTVTNAAYAGSRLVTRAVNVATSTTGGTDVVTVQEGDAQGRLWHVTEPSGGTTSSTAPIGSNQTTTYGYDPSGRLTSVTQAGTETTQYRWFTYDNRGFLMSERHPEKDPVGVTHTYDARGHLLTHTEGDANLDSSFTFDRAERLNSMFDGNGRLLKHYVYEDATPSDRALGKVRTATRYNYLPAGMFAVAETYTYNGVDGAVSKRDTTITDPASNPIRTFSQTFGSDATTVSLGYPVCTTGCPSGGSMLGTVTSTYDHGLLTSVASGATLLGTMTYWQNSALATVKHGTNGGTDVIDTYGLDPNRMARPASVSFDGYQDCAAPSTPVVSAANGTAGVTMTASTQSQPGASYNWTLSAGSITAGAGTNAIAFTAPAGTVTINVSVTTPCGGPVSGSASATVVTACTPPTTPTVTITPAPAGQTSTASTGSQPTGTVFNWTISSGATITGGNGTPSITFTAAAGSVTATVTVSNPSCGSPLSGSQTATIASACTTPSISAQPQSVTINSGSAASLAVAATASGGTLSYQWYRGDAPDTSAPVGANSSSFTTPALVATTHYWAKVTNTCSGNPAVNSATAIVSVRPPTPTGLVATATSGSQVVITWNAIAGMTYELLRTTNTGTSYSVIATPGASSFTDNGLSINTTYLYAVRAVDAQGVRSLNSALDPATTVLFDDPGLVSGYAIKAQHILQLRTAVNALRASVSGLGTATYTDPALGSGWIVKSVHISDLRNALAAARASLGLPAISFTDPTLTSGVTGMKAAHVTELRGGVQ